MPRLSTGGGIGFVFVGGTDILGHEAAGQGPVLVLVHGFPFDRRMWAAQGPGLADLRRVIALDLPGRGLSAGIPAEGASIDGYADAVAGVIRHVAGGAAGKAATRADIAGLSMGGYVALALWRRQPQLVRSLILSGTRAAADSEEGRTARNANADIAWSEGTIGLAETMLDRVLAPGTGGAVRARVVQMFAETPALTAIADLIAMRDRPDATGVLAGITVPALILRGEEDAIATRAESEAMAAAIPGARFVPVPGAGHLAPMENPEAWNAAVRGFLAGTAAGGDPGSGHSHSIVAGGFDEMS
jgi:3-oxoadipate enol-lactonase